MNPTYWALGISITVSVSVVLSAITFAYKFGLWREQVDSDRDGFRDFVKEIRSDIKEILSRLPPNPTSSSSPIRLTELGERISKNLDAKSWADKTSHEMFEQTRGMDSLKIQEESFSRAQNFDPDDELLQSMRDSAYQEGIDLSGVRKVLGVELRDCLLQLHNLRDDSLDG